MAANPFDKYDKPAGNYFDKYDPGAKPANTDGQAVSGFKRSFQEVPGMLAGVGAFAADVVGADGARDSMLAYAKRKSDEVGAAHAGDAQSLTDAWDGKVSWGDFLANAAGYVAGQALQSIVTGGVGALGAKMLANNGIKQIGVKVAAEQIAAGATEEIAKAAAIKAMTEAGSKAAVRGGIAGATAQNMNMELGSIYPDAVEEAGGADKLDNGDRFRVLSASALAAGVDTAGEALTAFKWLKGSTAGGTGILGRAAREVPAGMAREAGTEAIQTGIEQWGANKALDVRDIVDSAGVGAVGGAMAGGGASLRKREAEKQPEPKPDPVAAVLAAPDVDTAIKAAAESLTGAKKPAPAELPHLIPTADASEFEAVPAGDAAELDVETIQPADLMARDGQPFGSKTGAQAKAYASGGGKVVAIPDHFGSGVPGYVVRPLMQARPNNTRGTNAGDVPQAARQPAAAPAPAPAPAQPTEGPGSDAGNGFKRGPKDGERYRVGVVAAAGGAIVLEKRFPAGTLGTFYVGKDGGLIDSDNVNFIGNDRDRLWIPGSPEQAQQAQQILDEMGRLALTDPARKDAKARLKALVQGKTNVETIQPTEGPGSDAGNGFKRGPKDGERYRVGVVAAAGGAIVLEKRFPAGTLGTFYVGKDGGLIDSDNVNFIGNDRDRLWIPGSPEQAQQAQQILDEMGRLALTDPARKDAKARLKALVQGKTTTGAPSNAADVARPGGQRADDRSGSNGAAGVPDQRPSDVLPSPGATAGQGVAGPGAAGGGTARPDALSEAERQRLLKKWPGIKDKSDDALQAQERWDAAQSRLRALSGYRGSPDTDIQQQVLAEFGGDAALMRDKTGETKRRFNAEWTRRMGAEADRLQAEQDTPGTLPNARRNREDGKRREETAQAMQKATQQDIDANIARLRELERQGRITPADAVRLLELAQSSTDAFDAAMKLEEFVAGKSLPADTLPVGRQTDAANAAPTFTTGDRVALSGKSYTVTSATPSAVKLDDGQGGTRMVARNSKTFQAIQQEPNEATRPQTQAAGAEAAAPAAAPAPAPAAPAVVPGAGGATDEAGRLTAPVRTFASSGYQLTMQQALEKVKELEADARQRKTAAAKAPTAIMRGIEEDAASRAATLARKLREDIKQAVNSYPDARAEYAQARGEAPTASGAVEADGVKPRKTLQEARADAALDKQVRENGEVLTRRQWVERKVAEGLKTKVTQEDRIKPMSRMAYFRANNEEQRAHDRRVKEAGKKDVFWIGDYEVTKTEHDYANALASPPNAEAPVQAAPRGAEAAPVAPAPAERTPKAQAVKEALAAKKGAQPEPAATHKDPGQPAEPAAAPTLPTPTLAERVKQRRGEKGAARDTLTATPLSGVELSSLAVASPPAPSRTARDGRMEQLDAEEMEAEEAREATIRRLTEQGVKPTRESVGQKRRPAEEGGGYVTQYQWRLKDGDDRYLELTDAERDRLLASPLARSAATPEALAAYPDLQPAKPAAPAAQEPAGRDEQAEAQALTLEAIPKSLQITLEVEDEGGKVQKKVVGARRAYLAAQQRVQKLQALKECVG